MTFNLKLGGQLELARKGEEKRVVDRLPHLSLSTGWIFLYAFCSCNVRGDAEDPLSTLYWWREVLTQLPLGGRILLETWPIRIKNSLSKELQGALQFLVSLSVSSAWLAYSFTGHTKFIFSPSKTLLWTYLFAPLMIIWKVEAVTMLYVDLYVFPGLDRKEVEGKIFHLSSHSQ